MAVSARLGIVLVNWNGWADTLECLESVLRSDIPVCVVVVDNASADGSAERIEAWATGREPAVAASADLAGLSTPPIAKPVGFRRLSATDAATVVPDGSLVTLIDAGSNLGFAGGNNLGIRHLLLAPSIDHVWLLNNDTVIEPSAAGALQARMDATHGIGMCGTVIRFYFRPGVVQALNGSRFSVFSGQSRGIGFGTPATAPFNPARVARETDYVLGASLAVSRRFVAEIGLMSEHYFLYFEEIDWAYRNRGRFVIAFAHGAIVYHKEGGSIGSSHAKGQRSASSEYYLLRSRLGFVRRRAPLLLPLHWGLALGQIARRLLRLQPNKALVLARALLGMRFKSTRG